MFGNDGNFDRNAPLKQLQKTIVALRAVLGSAKIHWIRQFVETGQGIAAVGGVLDRVLVRNGDGRNGPESEIEEEIRSECVQCLRLLLNTEPVRILF